MVKEQGLTEQEVIESRKKYGTNDIGDYKKSSFIKIPNIISTILFST